MKFHTIVLDPPWAYSKKLLSQKARGGAAKHYPTMEYFELSLLPVQDLAAADCQLWLWTTNSHIRDAFKLLDEWGFEYKTKATWVKTQMGLGYWLRGRTEDVLLGTRGNPRTKYHKDGTVNGNHSTLLYELDDATPIVHAQRGAHSEKPQAFFDMVEQIAEPPFLEVFARKPRLGWESCGEDVDGEDILLSFLRLQQKETHDP